MVEGPKKISVDFVQLNRKELSDKIALLVSKNSRVIFWKNSPTYYEGMATHLEDVDKIILTLSKIDSLVKWSDEKICFHATVAEIDYFFSGKISLHEDEHRTLSIEVSSKCFRLEKRSRERLLTFPKYEVFAYLKYLIDTPKNLVFLNKAMNSQRDHLSKLHENRLFEMRKLSEELESENDNEDIAGFRVEDVSATGLCFFASQDEKEKILNSFYKEERNISLILNFGTQVFSLQEAKIVYMVDCIHPQFTGVTMFKVGVQFKNNLLLKQKIEQEAGQSFDITNFQKEFEEYIRNE